MRLLTPEEGVQLFERLVGTSFTAVAPCPIDVASWLDFYPELAGWPFVERLVREGPSVGGGGDAELLAAVAGGTEEDAQRVVEAHVIGETGRVLRMDPARIAGETPFTSLGLDSLMGLELRHRLQSTCGLRLPATAVWTFPTPQALARHLVESITGRRPTPEAPSSAPPAPSSATVDQLLAELAEIEDLLDA